MSEGVTVVTGAVEREGVKLSRVRVDGGTQMRAGLDADVVAAYVEVFQQAHAWGEFPPVTLFYDGADYWVGDGFHRLAAYREVWGDKNPSNTVQAVVIPGTRRDAILHAAGANASHGLRRTNADKRRAVEVLLRDEEWVKWGDAEIARRCAVSQPFVSGIRKEIVSYNGYKMPTERTVTRNGTTYTQNTANIGAGRGVPARPALPPVELMPIEDWELAEFVERVAGEVFGADRLGKEVVWNSMVIGAKGQTGEFWSRLRRALAPFAVDEHQTAEEVFTFVREARLKWEAAGSPAVDAGDSATAPSAEARRFGQEVKAATWGGVQRDDRPMVTAEGLANSLRGWAAQKASSALATAAEYRGGAVWFEARQLLSGLNYRDKELVAALGMLSEERGARGEEEGESGSGGDPWVAAWAQRVPEAFEDRVRRLAAEILPWTQAWTDDKGRTWHDLLDRNPQHANSPFRQDLDGECKRRGLLMSGGALAAVIEEMFAALTAPSDNPLLSDDEGGESREDAKPMYVPEFSKPLDRADELTMFAAKFKGLLGMNEFADGSLRRWGDLTGRHSETGEAERGLRTLLAITERERALLRGELAPEAEGWGV